MGIHSASFNVGLYVSVLPPKHQGPSGAQVGPSFVGYPELLCQHHGAKVHRLAWTVAVRLGFGGYLRSRCHGRPHQFVPCLVGGVVNSQLLEVDDMSGRAIVSLMVQCPGGWFPAMLYACHHQVHISLMPKGTHQRGGFDLQGLLPCIPLPSVGCLSPLFVACRRKLQTSVALSILPHLLVSKELADVEHHGCRSPTSVSQLFGKHEDTNPESDSGEKVQSAQQRQCKNSPQEGSTKKDSSRSSSSEEELPTDKALREEARQKAQLLDACFNVWCRDKIANKVMGWAMRDTMICNFPEHSKTQPNHPNPMGPSLGYMAKCKVFDSMTYAASMPWG